MTARPAARAKSAKPAFRRLAASAEVFELGKDSVLVRSGDVLLQLRGAHIARFMTVLSEVAVDELCGIYGETRTRKLLARLARAGLLSDDSSAPAPEPDAGPPVCAHPVVAGSITIHDPLALGADLLAYELRRRDTAAGAARSLHVVIVDTFVGGDRVAADVPGGAEWLALRRDAAGVWISPRFARGAAPCWPCFARRLISQDDVLALAVRSASGRRALHVRRSSAAFSVDIARCAAEFVDALCRDAAGLTAPAALVRLDAERGTREIHPARSWPDCTACRRAKRQRAFAVAARGSARGSALAETVRERLGHLVDPITGIVAEIDGRRAAAPGFVQVAITRYADPTNGRSSPLAVESGSGRVITAAARARTAFGAAEDGEDARAIAILEALERYCALYRGDEPVVLETRANLGASAIDTEDAEPGDAETPIAWTSAATLSAQPVFVPAAACYGYFAGAGMRRQPYSNNGNAIAFTRDDAIVRGFLEVVERDAVALWWYNRLNRPTVDIHAFLDPFAERCEARIHSANRNLHVFDLAHDFGIPVFAAMSTSSPADPPSFGFGAHFDPGAALRKALTELGQALCFAADERGRWNGFDWASEQFLCAGAGHARRATGHAPFLRPPTIEDCRSAAAAAGLPTFVKDLTRADVGIPAVKVIVPSALHPGTGRRSGRLVELPVKLGWLDRSRSAAELNSFELPM